MKKRPVIITLLLAIILSLIGGGFFYYKNLANNFNEKLAQNNINISTPGTLQPIQPKLDTTQSETILLLGTDYREGEGVRSDTMIILNTNKNTGVSTGISIPRDLIIEQLPACETWDSSTGETTGQTVEFYPYTMANEAYSVGGGACAVRMAEHISGLKIDRFIETSFEGFENVINDLGGVTLNICAPMIDDNLGELFTEAGEYKVNGQKALDFVRARKVYGDTGSDTSRMARQQYLLQQVKNESLNLGSLFGSTASYQALMSVAENTRTSNMTFEDMTALASTIQGGELNLFTLPTGQWELNPNRLIDNQETTEWVFSKIAQGEPVTSEEAWAHYNQEEGIVSYQTTTQTTRLGEHNPDKPCGWPTNTH